MGRKPCRGRDRANPQMTLVNRYRKVLGFVGRHAPETWAVCTAALVLLEGTSLAWRCGGVWLNRAGSVIVIIGIFLAPSRVHERVEQRAIDFVEKNLEGIAATVLPSTDAIQQRERVKAQ